MTDIHFYEVDLKWDCQLNGTLTPPVISHQIKVDAYAEITKGIKIKEKWTPEHLFVAAVNSCLMSTFLLVAENSKFQFISFDCNAVGEIEKIDGKFVVTAIVLKPTLIISINQNKTKAKRVLEMSEKACAIANPIQTKITLEPMVMIEH
ncbi:OsmC family protein [Pedobacter jamesrossensis]|uniref:OsmC family protein n=1 Tax=Pedobacter jamesrossensis TaxID=1908238 RepID=A0ABV8NKN5_9SPHI